MCYTTLVVFLNGIQNFLCVLVLVILNVTTIASFAHNKSVSELDDSRAFLMTVWHCRNFLECRLQLIPYLDLGKMRVLRVAQIGSSSY